MFNLVPVKYDEPLFRPPGEARSAILQATIGCSWNQCAFCEMYTSKSFKTRPFDELKKEIQTLAEFYRGRTRKVFLGDGDAMVLSANKILPVLKEVNSQFGRLQRISAYASPRQMMAKSEDELAELRKEGLKLLYVGIETGDDDLLRRINKGETSETTINGIRKAHKAGIDTSVMILNGPGGRQFSEQHARNSAAVINQTNPKFLSTLTLSLPMGIKHYENRFNGIYQQQTVQEIMEELQLFISLLDIDNVIFRSDHISNNLALSGTLSKDRDRMVQQIESAIQGIPEHLMPEHSHRL